MAHLSAFQMVTRTRACHVLLSLVFFLKINGNPQSICSYSSNISCQWLCWGDSPGGRVLMVSKYLLWLRRQMGAAAEENMQGWEFLCGSGGINTGQVIQFLIKVYFAYCMKVTESPSVAWNCKSSITSWIQWLKHMPSALVLEAKMLSGYAPQ